MDEMRLIEELSREAPPPSGDGLARARDRLVAAMAERPATWVRAVRPARRRSAWRSAWTGLAAVATAVIAVAVYVLAPDQVGGRVPAANAEAARVLNQAAAAALRVPDVEPRPDQFVYTRSQSGGQLRQDWRSVDGTRDGLALVQEGGRSERIPLPGCRDGRRVAVKGDRVDPARTEPCVPEPAYLRDLPADARGVRDYLLAHSNNPGDVNSLGKDILEISLSYLRPNVRAALFAAAAEIPGLTVVEHATDGGGRRGIGIGWSYEGRSGQLVFDADTHVFLGTPESAVLAIEIVDRVAAPN
ncbi:CU044_5270 family protein [Micromonospora sp. NPDC049559]|uniref:CU044_5270 family protein n=1 Tax=Micromonospora sp. NPDC049559 TaxID=3155923 RepID=UPI00341E9735